MDATNLDALVRAAAHVRHHLADVQAQVADARRAFETEHATLLATLDAARAVHEEAEATLRDAVLVAYHTTGSKRPHPAVGVRVCTRLVYDPTTVTAWARENLTPLLVLDTKLFEQVAPHIKVPGVHIVSEPQATIAQNLASWAADSISDHPTTDG